MNAPRLRPERSYAGVAASDRRHFPISSPFLVIFSLPCLNIKVKLIPLSLPSLSCQFTSLPRRFRHSSCVCVCVLSRGHFRSPPGSFPSLAGRFPRSLFCLLPGVCHGRFRVRVFGPGAGSRAPGTPHPTADWLSFTVSGRYRCSLWSSNRRVLAIKSPRACCTLTSPLRQDTPLARQRMRLPNAPQA